MIPADAAVGGMQSEGGGAHLAEANPQTCR